QTVSPLTFFSGLDHYPAWFPDSKHLAFSSERSANGVRDVYSLSVDSPGTAVQLTDDPRRKLVGAVSSDGKFLVFSAIGVNSDILALELGGEKRVLPLLNTALDERNPTLSPGGQWLAYEASDFGQM